MDAGRRKQIELLLVHAAMMSRPIGLSNAGPRRPSTFPDQNFADGSFPTCPGRIRFVGPVTFPLGRSSRSTMQVAAGRSRPQRRSGSVPFLQGLKEPDRLVEAEAMTIEDYRGRRVLQPRALRMQKVQLQVGHTINRSDSEPQASIGLRKNRSTICRESTSSRLLFCVVRRVWP